MRLSILLPRLLSMLDPRTWRRAPAVGGRIHKPEQKDQGVGGGNIDIGDKTQTGPG